MPVPWQTVPVFASFRNMDGNLRAGTYKIVSPVTVSATGNDAIVLPRGIVKIGRLNTDENLSMLSFSFDAPASDGAGIFPQDYWLQIEVVPEGGERTVYRVQPDLSAMPVGVDLSERIPDEMIPAGAPVPGVNVPGGLAVLGAEGFPNLSNRAVSAETGMLLVPSTLSSRPPVPAGYTLVILNVTNNVPPVWAVPGDLHLHP